MRVCQSSVTLRTGQWKQKIRKGIRNRRICWYELKKINRLAEEPASPKMIFKFYFLDNSQPWNPVWYSLTVRIFSGIFCHIPPPPLPLTSFQGSRGSCRAVLFHANEEHYKKELLPIAPCSRRLEEMGAIENGTHREHPRDKGAPLTLAWSPPGPRFFLPSYYLQAPATYDVYKEPKGANEPLPSQDSAYFSSKDSRIYVKTRNCIKWMYLQPTLTSDHFCLRCRSICTSYPCKILFFWIPRKSSLSILVINAP